MKVLGEITVEDVYQILQSLPDYKCPVCGGKMFSVLSFDGDKKPALRETIDVNFDKINIGDGFGLVLNRSPISIPSPVIEVICSQCGHVNFHDYMTLLKIINTKK